MKVTADLDLCQAHQMCQFEAPSVFGLTADEEKVVVLDANPDESLRAEVTAAIKYCPAMALSVTDVEPAEMPPTPDVEPVETPSTEGTP